MYLQIVLVALSGDLLHFPDHTPVSSIWTQAHQCTALASSIWQNPGKTCKFIVIHILALQQLSINTKKNFTLQSRVKKNQQKDQIIVENSSNKSIFVLLITTCRKLIADLPFLKKLILFVIAFCNSIYLQAIS